MHKTALDNEIKQEKWIVPPEIKALYELADAFVGIDGRTHFLVITHEFADSGLMGDLRRRVLRELTPLPEEAGSQALAIRSGGSDGG